MECLAHGKIQSVIDNQTGYREHSIADNCTLCICPECFKVIHKSCKCGRKHEKICILHNKLTKSTNKGWEE